uniref:Uncharacterized protein n=1 Tax=Ciona savignyi TaxID=51511 RepID=H2Y9J7_CIOSA
MFINYVIVVLLLCVNDVVFSTKAFENLRREGTDCNEACIANMDESSVSACKRGCRLFTICEWMTTPTNITSSLQECTSACDEAYPSDSSACTFGCQSSVPSARKRQNMLVAAESNIKLVQPNEEQTQDMLFPSSDDLFNQLFNHPAVQATDRIMQNMMQTASDSFQFLNSFMSSPSGTEIIDINLGGRHEVFVIEYGRRKPEINTPFPGFNKHVMLTESDEFKTTLEDRVETNVQTNANMPGFLSHELLIGGQFLSDNDYWTPQDIDTSWNCMSRKFWRYEWPELVLILFWLCTVAILFMLCVAQCAQPQQQSIHDEPCIKHVSGGVPSYSSLYPNHHGKKSQFYLASVVPSEDKVPLLD